MDVVPLDVAPHREIAVLYGTRPEAVRLAPVVNELRRRDGYAPVVIVTGRHRELLDRVNAQFGVVPDRDLGLSRRGPAHEDALVGTFRGFSEYLDERPADAVVVHGDTTTAFAGALVAHHRRIPLVHVGASHHTGGPRSPLPEDGDRAFVTAVAARHCAPTALAARRLRLENVAEALITVTGEASERVVDVIEGVFGAGPRGGKSAVLGSSALSH
ncbi:UDP-N-acetylglucosamine 2-epimerase [Myceligenerans pegani]|uniref:UDP-N-acetylglucosamine 2-epimerase (non-hydrolyzing) n=1 Tax=Myceligenerans pegani TaxID=2776917 RepID=A0ABR9N245_9MICO|nr:UDP-N-acetylglucosamine 2-epimerase [Myceligenerans sp. TRM 65318]MBE1877420.1 UDP-N-acetylglucosamine 2-epimerase [Myceligenerans sp. TRM 65318]MBE3019691.1 UDP-N-acetylglucosamine 2-epimerase [Myceligenerans sp. TRM 65318]